MKKGQKRDSSRTKRCDCKAQEKMARKLEEKKLSTKENLKILNATAMVGAEQFFHFAFLDLIKHV